MPDDIISDVMELARSKSDDGNEASDERVWEAYRFFKKEWTEIKE